MDDQGTLGADADKLLRRIAAYKHHITNIDTPLPSPPSTTSQPTADEDDNDTSTTDVSEELFPQAAHHSLHRWRRWLSAALFTSIARKIFSRSTQLSAPFPASLSSFVEADSSDALSFDNDV